MKAIELRKKKKTIEYGTVVKGILFCLIIMLTMWSKLTVHAEAKDLENFDGGTKHETRYVMNFKADMTDWQYYLYENPEAQFLYDLFSSQVDEEENRIFCDEFIVGLLANIEHEGAPGVVEHSFSKQHQYDFFLPNGGSVIENTEDIDYLLAWTITDEETVEGYAKKGSLGVSSLQWSYGRRITWLTILKDILQEKGKDTCNLEDLNEANRKMFLEELSPDYKKNYYETVVTFAEENGGTVDAYAEAICDYYVVPSKADLNMSREGDACIERANTAIEIWRIFESQNKQTYFIQMPLLTESTT